MKSTRWMRRKAAWLYAQFVVSKTVDVKKYSRRSYRHPRQHGYGHKSFAERAPNLGGWVGLLSFARRVLWTPTGINVPDYPKLAQIWWQQIGDVTRAPFFRKKLWIASPAKWT